MLGLAVNALPSAPATTLATARFASFVTAVVVCRPQPMRRGGSVGGGGSGGGSSGGSGGGSSSGSSGCSGSSNDSRQRQRQRQQQRQSSQHQTPSSPRQAPLKTAGRHGFAELA